MIEGRLKPLKGCECESFKLRREVFECPRMIFARRRVVTEA